MMATTTTTTNKPNHAKSKTNPLVQLLSSLQKQPHEEPYLLLVQYSRSFAQRQTCASSPVDVAVYQRASVRTPAQRAQRDAAYNEWLSEIIKLITTRMVWVETIGNRTVKKSNKTVVISAAQDPLGWDDDDESANMKDLHQLAATILKSATRSHDDDDDSDDNQTVVVFESLLPLVTLHGLDRTVDFLRYLMKEQQSSSSSTTLIVPILVESLTSSQHVVLEDLAHAVLMLQGGEATLLRRGVRERANLLRESVPFELDGEEGLQMLSPADEDSSTQKVVSKADGKLVEESSSAVPARQGRPGKVTLRHEEDGEKPKAAAPKPQIYLQDDDPEFDDMDEEDPDDDLDL